MSIEAMAYVKSCDFGDQEASRFLLHIIAENTFNDTFICVVGCEQLGFDIRKTERTVRRHIDALVEAGVLLRKARYPDAGGRLNDALRLVGFKRWYHVNYGAAKRRHNRANGPKTLPDKMSGSPPPLADKMSGRATGQQMSGVTGHLVSGTEESRNLPVNRKEAREGSAPSEVFNFDLEGKAVRDRLHHRFGGKIHDSWFSRLIVGPGDGGVAIAEAPSRFVRDWLIKNYDQALLAACREVWPETTRVEIRSAAPAARTQPNPASQDTAR